MASDNEACCESDPNFAVICGFLEKFGVTCGLANIDFLDLQDMLENSQEVPQELVDLHVKLLRKARKSVSSVRWERAIIKLCHGFCSQDAWEIERFGYKKARLSSKLRILKELLEMQFDYNAKFKNEINKLSAEELRTQPLGKDRIGHVYWFQSDNSCQIRVYKEDPDEETWSLVAKDREGLVNLITQLNDGQVTVLNEDSSSLESEKPVVDTGQTDSNSNSNSSKQDQTSPDTNTEENQVDITKKGESDSEKPQLDEEDDTQNNLEVAKLSKMKLKNNKVPISDDIIKVGESLGSGNGEGVAEQELKNEPNSEKEEKDKCLSTTLSPPKTGISIRIKPISELISSAAVDVNKKPEITGVKEKYIRSDSSSSSSVHHRKAVDSAGFDVHTNYLKRPIEEEEDVQEPSYIKRPRLDRPTLLGNKKKKPYSDEEDEEEEVSDEVEEPLMLVTGEGSGQDNEGGNSKFTETGSPIPEDDSPIVGEEIVESVVYFYGEGSGHACETGNESSPNKQDVPTRQESTAQSTTPNADAISDPNLQHTSHESDKADTIDSIKESEPSSNNETDCSVKTPTKSEFKLGTIIDVRTNKLIASARDPAKKSRWDIGKPEEAVTKESQISTDPLVEEVSENADVQCNSNSDIKLELKDDQYEKQKIELPMIPSNASKSSKGKVQELVNQWEKFSSLPCTSNPVCKDNNEKTETTTAPDETLDSSVPGTPKKTMFFFGPGCLQVKPTISPIKSDVSESFAKNSEQQVLTSAIEDDEKIQEVPNLQSDTQMDDKLNPLLNLDLKTGSYEVTGKAEMILASNQDSSSSKKKLEELKDNDVKETFKKPQAQKSLRNADSQRKIEIKIDVPKSDALKSQKNESEKLLKNTENQKSITTVLEKHIDCGESKLSLLQENQGCADNNIVSLKESYKHIEQENIKSNKSENSSSSKLMETAKVKEVSVSPVTEIHKTAKHNEEKVESDPKMCDNLKLSGVQEVFPVTRSEMSTPTIFTLGNAKEEDKVDKICNLPNNIVTDNHHVPKNSVNKKELEKIDNSSSSIGDQKNNKLNDVPVSEKSLIPTVSVSVESEKTGLVFPKVAGLPVAEEQVENANTSVLDNKPKSKLEDVQEDIKKVNIQKTDSIDLSVKNKDSSSKLELNATTSKEPCSIEMQMAMIMGENMSDMLDIHAQTVSNANISVASNSSTTPPIEDKCLLGPKIIIENPLSSVKQNIPKTTDNVSLSSLSKPPSNFKASPVTEMQNLECLPVEDTKIQTPNKDVETSSRKKIVLKRSVDKNALSTDPSSSSPAPATLVSKPVVDLLATVHNKEKTSKVSSTLKKESHTKTEIIVPSIKTSVGEVVEPNVKNVDEKQSASVVDITPSTTRTVVDTTLPISSNTNNADVQPIPEYMKSEDTHVAQPTAIHKLDEKQSFDTKKDVSSFETKLVKDQRSDITKKNPDVAAEKKLNDQGNNVSPDTISSVSKSINVVKLSNTASNLSDTSSVAKKTNATAAISSIKPVVKKSTEKRSPEKVDVAASTKIGVVDAKPSVSATKSEIENVNVVSSTAKVSEIRSPKKILSVKQDVKTSDKISVADPKFPLVSVASKPSNDTFRIPAEYQSKKSSSASVSSINEKPVFNINEVIVNATSGIPSNVNKSRVISLTEILSTSEKVPLSATKGGISKPSVHKPPVAFKEAPPVATDVNKQNITKSKGTTDAIVNKLSTNTNVPNVDKTDTLKANKSSIKNKVVEDKIVTNIKVGKAEADSAAKPLTPLTDASIKAPAAPVIAIEPSGSLTDKPMVDTKPSATPVLSKDKSVTDTKQPLRVIPSKDDKVSVEAITLVESSDKFKTPKEIKTVLLEPISAKSTLSVETKSSADELKSAVAVETATKTYSSKGKSSVDTNNSTESAFSKDKSLLDIKQPVELVLLKEELPKETKKPIEPIVSKKTSLVETKDIAAAVSTTAVSVEVHKKSGVVEKKTDSSKDKKLDILDKKSDILPKTSDILVKKSDILDKKSNTLDKKSDILVKKSDILDKKSDSSKDKLPAEIKHLHKTNIPKDKISAGPALIKDKSSDHTKESTVVSKNETEVKAKSTVEPKIKPPGAKVEVETLLSNDELTEAVEAPVVADALHAKEKESSNKFVLADEKVSVKTKSLVVLVSPHTSMETKVIDKESIKSPPATPADDNTTNRRTTRRTRSNTFDKSESSIDNKNKKSVNNKVTPVTKKIESFTRKGKKSINDKNEDENEATKGEKIEEIEKPQKSDDADAETPKGKGRQKKKVLKENENEEKNLDSKKVHEPQVVGDTNRELRHRKVAEANKNKAPTLNENEEKKPRGRGRPKGKASTVVVFKEEGKAIPTFTRSQAQLVKDKEGTHKADSSKENLEKNDVVEDLGDIEEQIVKTEIRPSKKLRLSDSAVEITVIDKNKKTITVSTSEKGKESDKVEPSDEKPEPIKTRRSLRSSQLANADNTGKGVKDQGKVSNEPKVLETDKKEKRSENSENRELKPVDEPLCVQKKVPLLTCIDISKLKAPQETTSETSTPDINENKPIDSDSDGSFGAGDIGIDADGDSSDDAVVILPENDPLACSDEDAHEPAHPPMTMATFKLDTDDATPTTPLARVTRKRAAQQSVDALRDTRVQKKKTQLEKTEEVDSKKPKLKKRSVDRNLRRSIEEQKMKTVSSSEEEEGDNNDVNIKSDQLPKQDSGKKSKSIAKRRISTRSTRATESPVPSSDPLSEASRTDASNTPPVVKEKKPRKTKKTLLGLEISEATETLLKGEAQATVRQSRRIAQIKIKEEAERRKLEEVTLQELKDEQRKRKGKKSEDKDYKIEKRKRNKNLPTEDETTCDAESDEKKKRKRKRKHWDPTKKFDLFKAWKSSSGSSSSEVEDEEEEIEEDDDHQLVVKSDHEFSPESDLEEGAEVQPLKRARTARKESDAEEVDDCACQKCGQKDHPEWILLCDSCDCGWHCSCLRPALLVIPEGDWFCPPCQHLTLVKNLEERLHEYDRKINKKEMETRRKERLAYVGISLDNVLPSKETDEHRQKQRQQQEKESGKDEEESGESGSDESDSNSESCSSSGSDSDEPVYQLRERRQAHSYRFNDYDELINSAIQDELEAVKGAGNQGRGKDIATIVNAEKEEAEAQRLKSENVGTDVVPPSDATVATVSTDSLVPVSADAVDASAPENSTLEPLPPVVPPDYDAKTADDSDGEIIRPVKKIIGKKKHRKLNCLDVSSDDDAESDEDFKGSSSSESEEDFDEDEYTGSESSDADTKRGKRRKDFGPVRRSTRARISRYDRDFVNDSDSEEEEAPRRKKTRSIWDESESEESDRSWGRRKRKAANRSRRRKSSAKAKKSKKKKKKRRTGDDSDPEVYRKKPNIKFGGLNDDEEVGRRTRGKKINYLEALGTDSEEEIRRKPPRIEESEEEYNLHEDEDFQQQLENEKDSDESGVDTVLQDIAKNTQPRPKARGRGKSGLKIPRKPKDAPPPEFSSLMPDLSQPTMEPSPSIMDPTVLQSLQPLQAMQPLMEQPSMLAPSMLVPSMLAPSMIHESDLQDPEDEPNPIEQINKNVEQMNEQEMEKMMEEEDYANKQLQLVALQIEKEKKRKEREAKRLEKLMEKEQKIPKKRGRKPKNQMVGANADLVPPYSESASMMMNSVMANNAELSEPPGVSLPMFSEIAPVLNADGTPKKRRGRGKDSPMHGTKLGIAAPPQPFSQSQPTPSVITRMLQSQPGQGSFPGGGTKYFGGLSGDPQLGPPPGSGSYHPGASGPRGPMPGPYQQPPPGMPHYPVVRSGPAPPHRLHSPGPPGLPPMYHTHRSMDPSPSGGGPINVSTTNRDRHSPAIVSPSSSSPLSKGDPTPPPPPYTRPQVGHFASGVVSSAATGPRHVSMVPPHLQQHRGSNMSPYHPGVPPNYHYGSYPPPPPLNTDEGQSPPVYPSPAYSEPYPGEGTAPVQPSEGSSNKPFDEDTGGEFVGLVSYFSSQREDDLDT